MNFVRVFAVVCISALKLNQKPVTFLEASHCVLSCLTFENKKWQKLTNPFAPLKI